MKTGTHARFDKSRRGIVAEQCGSMLIEFALSVWTLFL